ncbi:MAG TPA: tetratricopeptide repeat protein [Candidatus Acidoferrales bacterium]|nr:tetratricopeptide repeat protein [Candidatus Acidoferrales bacterium]
MPNDLRDEIFDLVYSKKRTEEAVLRLNGIIKASPENSMAIALKAYALNKLANQRKEWGYSRVALETAERALNLNPDDDIALTSKGWALIDLRRPSEAVPILARAISVNPSNEYAWYNLAWAQYLTGNAATSSESMARALAISPNNHILKAGKDLMTQGRVPAHLKQRTPT